MITVARSRHDRPAASERGHILFRLLALLTLAITPQRAAELAFERVAIDDSVKDPWAKIVADIDSDGFPDIIIGGRSGPLVWYRYPDWSKHVIAQGDYKTVDGEAGDVDGDGDLDIVMGGLIWYENPGSKAEGSQDAWKSHRVAQHPTHDLALADLDGDGRLDLVTRDQSEFGSRAGNTVHVWWQARGDRQWTHQIMDCPHGEGLEVGDIDGDGAPDIVVGGLWLENSGRSESDWAAHRFADWHPNATVRIADVNEDGRADVVLAPSELAGDWHRLSWFEAPNDPKAPKWREHIISDRIESVVHGLATGDFNADGAVDVAASEMHQGQDPDEVVLFLNQDAGAGWEKMVLSTRGSHYIQAGDIDADGDLDLVGANWSGPYQPVELWRNKLLDLPR